MSSIGLYVWCLAIYICWRLWRFTLQPYLRPNQPRSIPYWIPYIGNAFQFLRSFDATITRGLDVTSETGGPFSISVFGQKIHFVVDEIDVSVVLREHPDLTHQDHVRDLLQMFGSSTQGLKTMYHPFARSELPGSKHLLPNPQDKPLALLAEDLMQQQLLPMRNLKEIESAMASEISRTTQIDWIPQSAYRTREDRTAVQVSVLDWCQNTLIRATTNAFFGSGPFALAIEPTVDLIGDTVALDTHIWALFFHLPPAFSRSASLAQNAATKIRNIMHALISEKDPHTIIKASSSVRTSLLEMRARGISNEDISSYLLQVHWGVNANMFKVAFWLLAHITNNPQIQQRATTEVDKAADGASSLLEFTKKLENSAYFAALYQASLLACNNSSSERTVVRDTIINGNKYEKGSRIMVPFRQMARMNLDSRQHDVRDESVRPELFLKDGEKESLRIDRSFRPFGSGKHQCPGRFITRRAAMLFVGLVLERLEVKALNKLPEMDLSKPPFGPVAPVEGQDCVIEVRKRELSKTMNFS